MGPESNMTNVLIRREDTETDTERERPCVDRSDVSTSQGIPRIVRRYKKLEEARKEAGPANTLISGL